MPPSTGSATFLLLGALLLPSALASVSLTDIQQIIGFNSKCTSAYGTTVDSCSLSDFTVTGNAGSCSSQCFSDLTDLQTEIQKHKFNVELGLVERIVNIDIDLVFVDNISQSGNANNSRLVWWRESPIKEIAAGTYLSIELVGGPFQPGNRTGKFEPATSMRKTLLLVYIHGFHGGDDTFAAFPAHLSGLVSRALPNIDVLTEVYPRFKTRGELGECVARFREWLENKVIDLEVAHSTPSPTIDPSVHVILLGHSMGGIVAAETYLLLASEQPIAPAHSATNGPTSSFLSDTATSPAASQARSEASSLPDGPDTSNFMFPHIQAILAFDTPFLGLAPSMVAHQLEGGHKMASNAYNAYNEMAGIFGWGSKSESNVRTEAASATKALPAPAISSTADAAAAPQWQRWGKYAMFAGAAGAVAAGGAAALYNQRAKITAGWSWASSHLLFVGDLAKPEILRRRVEMLEKAVQERGAACANLYTLLGRGAREGYGVTSAVKGPERTFANLPVKARDGNGRPVNARLVSGSVGQGMLWWGAANENARDETSAHMSMFTPRENPGFYAMARKSKDLIAGWVDEGWYNTSEKRPTAGPDEQANGLGEDWEKADLDDEQDEDEDEDDDRAKGWEGLDGTKHSADDDDYHDDHDDNKVRMRDEDKDGVVVDKA
ncbi:hypothetical protein DV737_g639, partial [Chaetothyriales sp. CBS 132003]